MDASSFNETQVQLNENADDLIIAEDKTTSNKDMEKEVNEKFQLLLDLFPDGDFNYMKSTTMKFIGKDEEFRHFIEDSISNQDFPKSNTKCEIKANLFNTSSLETIQYSLQSFVNKFKDPFDYFHNCSKGPEYKNKMIDFLKDRFRYITTAHIEAVVLENNFNLMLSINCLEDTADPAHFNEVPRLDDEITNYIDKAEDDFLYEIEFVNHKEEILEYMKIIQDEKEYALEKGKILGELLVCECCTDENVLADDVVTCTNGHVFCNECFQRSVDVIMADAKIKFPCFQECEGKFPMDAVKKVLTVKDYNKLLSRIQYREVRAADIPGIEFCINCDYGAIPAEKDEIFHCEKCFIKICRKCKKEDHFPRKCNESEEEFRTTQERIKSEEQKTYNIVRICRTCNVDYIKESGCNKMTCTSCGTLMCYLCGKVIEGYQHFDTGNCKLHY